MITVIAGENSYAAETALTHIVGQFVGEAEKYSGEALEIRDLSDLLAGVTLFAAHRLVIVRNVSENKPVWDALEPWVERIDEDTHLVLVEQNVDKRTKTYKTLQKKARIIPCDSLTERDRHRAIAWLRDEAVKHAVDLDEHLLSHIIDRSMVASHRPGQMVIDQGIAAHSLAMLALKGTVREQDIADLMPPSVRENVFDLFLNIVQRTPADIAITLEKIREREDPYMVMGMLIGQLYRVSVLAFSPDGYSVSDVAKDLGIHEYALGKMQPVARKMPHSVLNRMVDYFVAADERAKNTSANTWDVIYTLALQCNACINK